MLLRLIAAVVLGTATLTATAEDHAHHAVDEKPAITQVWSRAMPPTAPTGAVYFRINNPGEATDKLVGVQTPRAEKAELHTHVHKGEVMSMQRIESVELAAGGEVEFKPGGNHVMLFKLKEPLVAGEHFPMTLIFEKAGEVTVDVSIHDQAPQATDSGHHHH
ncbi:copper chaperone PCu(A)C [Stutzerimonas zhaodongensis]|uniref:copper chaperone PCu(A)C n=1 Tax=Stutzerimonas zhaodongensis TaxID=1176257 RepID=UPI0021082126|nr:copper chaperone PCu(A)C [Stutzerimonas zhaodongensis]MCQ2029003.1 copper chaperone PCu(A)C [Stutzerimonas zhaodongensis]